MLPEETETDFLRSYSNCRDALLRNKIEFSEIDEGKTYNFSMFFDANRHPNVFFLDAEMTLMVYVHDACPYPSFFRNVRKYPSASLRRPHFNCDCERVSIECGLVLPWRKRPITEEVGKKNHFWDLYGKVSENYVLFRDEKTSEDESSETLKRKSRAAALARRTNNSLVTTACPPTSDKFDEKAEKKDNKFTYFSYFPWQKMSYEEWEKQMGPNAEKGYSSLREAKLREEKGVVRRNLDRVLKEHITLVQETNWTELAERDEATLVSLERNREWERKTSYFRVARLNY